ncbi:MAG: transporter substrate-binding domain-containing protein [Alphaproteobacteria bacterium]|nr:transporter substrate-binding domain-containing protein [Alphaproteobacteria bacterium]
MKLKLFLSSLLITISAQSALAEDAGLQYINTGGAVRCGIPTDNQFLAYKDENNNLKGIAVEICRIISTAVFGRSDRIKMLSLPETMVNDAISKNKIDVMIGGLAYSASNEISNRAAPIDVVYYDRLAFIAENAEQAKSMKDFTGEKVCLVKDTDDINRLLSYNNKYNLNLQMMPAQSFSKAKESFFLKRCRLLLGNYTTLKDLIANNPSSKISIELLPETVDIRPIYLFADRENPTLRSILKWIMNAPKLAEDLNINQTNYTESLNSKDPVIANLLGTHEKLWKSYGLESNWVQIMLRERGNYGEIFTSSLGEKSPFKLKRKHNKLKKDDGLITSFPFL